MTHVDPVRSRASSDPVAVLILHGWFGSGLDHWQARLALAMRRARQRVFFPTLPDPATPEIGAWLAAMADEMRAFQAEPAREHIVVGHSLGAVLWMQYVVRHPLSMPVDRVLLVAPPSPSRTAQELPRFVLPDLDPAAVRAAAHDTLLVGSDADPWCPEGVASAYAEPLGIRHVLVPGGRHFALDDGYGPWPEPIAWCRDPSSVWA